MRPDEAHLRLLTAAPADLGLDVVLGDFGPWVWEQHVAGHADVVQRSLDYLEWLFEHAPEAALGMLDGVFGWGEYGAGYNVGRRTRAALDSA